MEEVLRIAAPAVAGVTAAGAAFVLRRVYRREAVRDAFIARALLIAAALKVVGTLARYSVLQDVYDGSGDATRYFFTGRRIGAGLRTGVFPENLGDTGTPFMEFIAGVFYAVAPDSMLAGFLFFSALSFVGTWLFFCAFRLAVPDGDHRRYAILILFLPTMLFWPSSMGKESWLVFALGVSAYGAARVLRRQRYGYLLLFPAATGAFMVRPHMAALFLLCFAGALVLRFRDPEVKRGAVAWILSLLIVGYGAGFAAVNFGDELPRDELVEGTTTDQIFAETQRRTDMGGSAFDSRPVRGPADLGHALLTVPFRPFPHEAGNAQAVLASLEGIALLVLILASIPRLLSLPSMLLRRPYVAMSVAYTLGFVIAFSNVANFGLLTRQRAQLMPFLLVLLALPRLHERRARRRERQAVLLDATPQRDGVPVTANGPLLLAAASGSDSGALLSEQSEVSLLADVDRPVDGEVPDDPLPPSSRQPIR